MKIDFTKDEIENLREFIEFGFIEYLKTREQDFDNVRYLFSMGNVFDKLERAEKTLKECTEMCEPETDYRYDTEIDDDNENLSFNRERPF